MRKYIIMAACVMAAWSANAQTETFRDIRNAAKLTDEAPLRTEFISYEFRENADKGMRTKNQYYSDLKLEYSEAADGELLLRSYRTTLDVPVLWLDREFVLHTENVGPFALLVNGSTVGVSLSPITPAEFHITGYITDGVNEIELQLFDAGMNSVKPVREPLAYIYSQPKIRIEDFRIGAVAADNYEWGTISVDFFLINDYNFPELINIGYDVYDPNGKLQYFDNRDLVVPGLGRDTIKLSEPLWAMPAAHFWTAENPALYYGMLIVRHGRRYTEYIPYRTGFGQTAVKDRKLYRNGKQVEINAVRYNAAADRKTTEADMAKLKKAGVNTIMVDYPQPFWFYDLTDEKGFYVFDRPDFSFAEGFGTERTPGGTPANHPELLFEYMYRTKAMFARSRNRVSIVGWSLGGTHGNGYNLYKTYLWLKENDPDRPVIYNGADGEWNSDMEPITARDAHEILDAESQTKAPATQNRRR